jgi:hypothetical protein
MAGLTTATTWHSVPVVPVATDLLRGRRSVAILQVHDLLEVALGPLLAATGLPFGTTHVTKLVPTSASVGS